MVICALEALELRVTPAGNLALTGVQIDDSNGTPLSTISAGEMVFIQANFTAANLPGGSSYDVAYSVNGLTRNGPTLTFGAGVSRTNSSNQVSASFIATPAHNQVAVTIDPGHTVAETTYADNSSSITFNAVTPAVGNFMSYDVAQIRDAYGLNSIPAFGTTAADGTGQTIAIVDAFNDPTIVTDLDGFDRAMSLSLASSASLYDQYGPASSILSVYNETGTNITSEIAASGTNGIPAVDPTGSWETEETMDVEWAHAMAPGAHIDLVETNGTGDFDDLFKGAATAALLPDVSVMSMSWIWNEDNWVSSSGAAELAYDSSTFTTPSGHPGITFLASLGRRGRPRRVPGVFSRCHCGGSHPVNP